MRQVNGKVSVVEFGHWKAGQMGDRAMQAETAEQRFLLEKIEMTADIVRKSQAVVAFQRVFFWEMLTFERIETEVDDFLEKVNRLQGKLSELFNELQHVNQPAGAGRASSISEKLDTLKSTAKEFQSRCAECKERRKLKSKELNEMVLPELNHVTNATIASMDGIPHIRGPNLTTFVNDPDYRVAEDISGEWMSLRRKLDNYFQRYVEDITSVRVEVFGATYALDATSVTSFPEYPRNFLQRISGLIQSRGGAHSSKDYHHSHGSSHKKRVGRSESFFYCPTAPAPAVVDPPNKDIPGDSPEDTDKKALNPSTI